jgi:hypothetical protein
MHLGLEATNYGVDQLDACAATGSSRLTGLMKSMLLASTVTVIELTRVAV